MRGFAAFLLLSGVAGCRHSTTPAEEPAAPSAAPAATSAAPAATSAAPVTSADSPAAPSAASPSDLPPIDATCRAASDCGLAYTYLIDGKCCNGTCSPKPASGAWLELAEERCKKLGWEEQHCPTKKCVPPPELACVAGRCVFRAK